MNSQQYDKVRTSKGFIAALDQSGGSTPKALRLYGINEGTYSGDEAMFDLVHAMRCRILTSPEFTSEKSLAAILFEWTVDGVANALFSSSRSPSSGTLVASSRITRASPDPPPCRAAIPVARHARIWRRTRA